MTRRRLATVAVATAATTALTGGVAAAVWTVTGTGAGGSKAVSLAPATFAAGQGATAVGTTVTITWTNGANPSGTTYQVVRNSTPAATLSCTASPCTDAGAPAGTYNYTVTSKLHGWAGPSATTGNVVVAPVTVQTPAPSTPDLHVDDDSGTSNTDNVTKVARPRFTGTAAADALVKLYRAGVQIGSQQLTGGATSWTITPTADVAEGADVAITATAQVSGQLVSGASASLAVTFDRTAPSVTVEAATGQNQPIIGTATRTADDSTVVATVTFSAVLTAGGGSCQLSATSRPVLQSGSTYWAETKLLLDNNSRCAVTVTQLDLAGNSGAATADFVRGTPR